MKYSVKLAISILALMSLRAIAVGYIPTDSTTISNIYSYTNYGNGDVAFRVANPIDECSHGYWFNKDDAGFSANLTMIIAAYQAKSTVKIYGLPDQLWAGSSGKYCKLYNIQFN